MFSVGRDFAMNADESFREVWPTEICACGNDSSVDREERKDIDRAECTEDSGEDKIPKEFTYCESKLIPVENEVPTLSFVLLLSFVVLSFVRFDADAKFLF